MRSDVGTVDEADDGADDEADDEAKPFAVEFAFEDTDVPPFENAIVFPFGCAGHGNADLPSIL